MKRVFIVGIVVFLVGMSVILPSDETGYDRVIGSALQEGARYYDRYYYADGSRLTYYICRSIGKSSLGSVQKLDIFNNPHYNKFVLDKITATAFEQLHMPNAVIGPKYLDVRRNQDRLLIYPVDDIQVIKRVDQSIPKILTQIHLTILKNLEERERVCHDPRKKDRHPLRSKSTAVVASVSDKIIISQVGTSSRALLCRSGRAIELTSKDKRYAGKIGDPRVKELEVYEYTQPLHEDDEFLVLFTDGIDEVTGLTDQDVVQVIRERLAQGGKQLAHPSQLAQALVDEATRRVAKKYFPHTPVRYVRDDMAVVVVRINKGYQGLAAIFDGTGPIGSNIAQYCKSNFPILFAAELEDKK
jgi:serine/threonine protein phosphatase PrpC